MPKWVKSDVLDSGINYIKTNASKLLLVSAYAAGDSYATVVSKKLAEVAMVSGDYTLASSSSDRTLTTAAGKTSNAVADSTQYDTGNATSGGATTLTDTAKAWTVNVHANRAVVISAGTGAGQHRRITSNTATALTVPAWTTNPDNTSVYKIVDDLHWVFTDGAANVIWATDETTDQAITTGNPINYPQLVYTASQPV